MALHMARKAKTSKDKNQSLLWLPLENQSDIMYKTRWPTLEEMQLYQFSEALKRLSGSLVEWHVSPKCTVGRRMAHQRVKCFAPLFPRLGCGNKAVPLVYSLCGGVQRMYVALLMFSIQLLICQYSFQKILSSFQKLHFYKEIEFIQYLALS